MVVLISNPKSLRKLQFRTIEFLLLVCLTFQVMFWYKTEKIKPKLGIVPNVPNNYLIKALSFGDEEFYFRTQAFKIQNAGDTFGRFSALKDYDYKKLYEWFKVLDSLDSRSNYIPSLAAYYYSMTQNSKDTIYIINYLEEHADKDPETKWWWYYQAMSIANYIYGDQDRALALAYKLSAVPGIPLMAKEMPAIMHKARGEDCQSIIVLNEIYNDYQKEEKDRVITDKQLNFMKYFIERRIQALKEKNFDPEECLKQINNN